MAKATKTWKIGEYCKGGIITAEINGKIITLIGKEWDYSKGSTRGSDQSKAKEFIRGTITSEESNAERKIMDFLGDLTTHYYSSEVMKWIESKVSFKSKFDW